MTLDKNKIITESVQTPPVVTTTTPTASSVATPSSKPLSMKVGDKQDPLTEAIKNEDFQKLSEEEQLKRLKRLYIQPSVRVRRLEIENLLVEGSITNVNGNGDDTPGYGGGGTGPAYAPQWGEVPDRLGEMEIRSVWVE